MGRLPGFGLLSGEPATLERPDGTTTEVEVLIRQADLSDQTVLDVQTKFINQARYKGDSETLTCMWPKDSDESLRDCHVWARGNRYRVYGDPIRPTDGTLPTRYDRRVTLNRALYLSEAKLLSPTSTYDEWMVQHNDWDGPVVPVNLLRLSEESNQTTYGLSRADYDIVLIELLPDLYDGQKAFEFDGRFYTVTATTEASDSIVLSGRGDYADG